MTEDLLYVPMGRVLKVGKKWYPCISGASGIR